MKIHTISFYTILYLLIGYRFKLLFCNATDGYFEEISIVDSSEGESGCEDPNLAELDLDVKKNTDKFTYNKYGKNANLFTAKDDYRVKKITSSGELVWESSRNEYPNRVYFEERPNAKPLIKLIYSDQEFDVTDTHKEDKKPHGAKPYTEVALPSSGGEDFVQYPKSKGGPSYINVPMPSSGEEDVKIKRRGPPVYKHKKFQQKRFMPVSSTPHPGEDHFKNIPLPQSGEEYSGIQPTRSSAQASAPVFERGSNYVQMALPSTGEEGPSHHLPRPVHHASRPGFGKGENFVEMPLPQSGEEGKMSFPPRVRSGTHGSPTYVQMPLPPSGDEEPPFHSPRAFPHASGPGFDKGENFVEMALPQSGEETSLPVFRKVYPKPENEKVQNYLEFGIPHTDDEEAEAPTQPNYLEINMASSGEDEKLPKPAETTLPKRRVVETQEFHETAIPASTASESGSEAGSDMEFDAEILALTQKIEKLKIQIEMMREVLRLMDEEEAQKAKIDQTEKKETQEEQKPAETSESAVDLFKIYTLEDNTLYENDTSKYNINQTSPDLSLININEDAKCVKFQYKDKYWNFNPSDPIADYASAIKYDGQANHIIVQKTSGNYEVLVNVN